MYGDPYTTSLARSRRGEEVPPDGESATDAVIELRSPNGVLEGPLAGYRVWRGPWRWMLCVYEVLEDQGHVVVLSVHDTRSSTAPL